MKEYSVSDYGIFSDAIGTTTLLNNKISDAQTSVSSLQSALSEDVFMGPIADSCIAAFNNVNTNMSSMSGNFTKISSYLSDASTSYQQGDTSASNVVLNLDSGSTSKTASNSGGMASSLSTFANPNGIAGQSQTDFINSIKDGAVASYNEYGVLPSVTIAQAILESGWGKYSIGNNLFGIKAGSGWNGKVQNVLTTEQNSDGSSYQIYDDFRDYDSISDSIKDHGKLFTQDFYKPVVESNNYVDACRAVQNCGYATATNYADSLIELIDSYGLDQWDPK